MADSESGGATVDVSHYSFRHVCYRGGVTAEWGVYSDTLRTYYLSVGQQMLTVVFWSSYVQIGIYRNNTTALQTILVRANSYVYRDFVSDKYFISAVTFGEDEVFNPPFVNMLESTQALSNDYVDEYLDYCQVRRMYELSSPVASTATVTEIRIPYSFLSWRLMDVDNEVYNEDGSLKSGYETQNYMFSDFEN